MIAKVETDLHAELDIIDPDKRIGVLIRHLAVARLARNFEQMHRTLREPNTCPKGIIGGRGGKASRAESITYFDQVKAQYADFYEKNTFDEWIRYPASAGPIEVKNERDYRTWAGIFALYGRA